MWLLNPVLAWLGNLLGGPFAKAALEGYKAHLDSVNSHDAKTAELALRELDVEQKESEVNAQIVEAEQGKWYTALPRPLFAFAFIIFIWKVIVVDKVIGPGCLFFGHLCWVGNTDNLPPIMWKWGGIILAAYFGGRTAEKVARIIALRK